MFLNRFSRFWLLALPLALAACEPTIATRGNILDQEKMDQVQIGKSTREEVATLLGTPTQVGTFDENVWYYVGRNTEQYSFLDPEIIKQKAVEVRFSDEGLVTALRTYDPSLVEDISPNGDKTPTYGHETTIAEQLMGNIGHPAGLGSKQEPKN